jgi:hypothetical protein
VSRLQLRACVRCDLFRGAPRVVQAGEVSSEEVHRLLRSAELGNAQAQFDLGRLCVHMRLGASACDLHCNSDSNRTFDAQVCATRKGKA